MPTIPTPFVGGSGGPDPEGRETSSQMPPPFAPGVDDAELARRASESAVRESAGTVEEVRTAPPVEAGHEPPVPEESAAEEDLSDLPDFLFGSDAVGTDDTPAEVDDASQLESARQLADMAHQLIEGAHGGYIRALIADLSSLAAEIAVPRAFAAGYRAAREEQES